MEKLNLTKVFIAKFFLACGILVYLFFNTNVLEARLLPEFSQTDSSQWINSDAISVDDLKGNVVLIDIWTFECWNCYRSFPWLNDLESRYAGKGLKVIGIHTPEFARERVISNIKKKVKQFKLHHAIMVDNDMAYWKALRNRYWPAFYVVDKKGNIRNVFIGETHKGDTNSTKIESLINTLLLE